MRRFRTVHAPAPQWNRSGDGQVMGSGEAALRREDRIVFVIRLLDGEEVHAAEGDKLTVNEQTGVLTVHRIDGFDEVTPHYSPSAWGWVTHRIKGARGTGRHWSAPARARTSIHGSGSNRTTRILPDPKGVVVQGSQRFRSIFPACRCHCAQREAAPPG